MLSTVVRVVNFAFQLASVLLYTLSCKRATIGSEKEAVKPSLSDFDTAKVPVKIYKHGCAWSTCMQGHQSSTGGIQMYMQFATFFFLCFVSTFLSLWFGMLALFAMNLYMSRILSCKMLWYSLSTSLATVSIDICMHMCSCSCWLWLQSSDDDETLHNGVHSIHTHISFISHTRSGVRPDDWWALCLVCSFYTDLIIIWPFH